MKNMMEMNMEMDQGWQFWPDAPVKPGPGPIDFFGPGRAYYNFKPEPDWLSPNLARYRCSLKDNLFGQY
jgi:hypothetical protein